MAQKKTNQEINKRIQKVNGAMALEGMPLTNEDKGLLNDCLQGKTTNEFERQKIIREYKQKHR